MATQYVDLIYDAIVYISENNPNSNTQLSILSHQNLYTTNERIYYHFANFPDNLKYKKLIEANVEAYVGSGTTISLYAPSESFNPATITWNTRTGGSYGCNQKITSGGTGLRSNSGTPYETSERTRAWLKKNGVYVRRADSAASYVYLDNDWISDHGGGGLRVWYDDGADLTSQIKSTALTSGYINPRNAQTFKWDYVGDAADGTCFADFVQSSAVFYWREGTSGAWTAVNISGSTKSVTIAANTFPAASTIQYYLKGTDTLGTTSQTSEFTLSTTAGTVSTTIVRPNNTVEDGSATITFEWQITSTDGQAASRVEGEWKKDTDGSWTSLFDVSSPITTYSAAGGTFPAGSILWRVRAYNIDGTAGSYSQGSFISVAAPDPVEGLTATNVPFSTISWQSDGQQAYRIVIDDMQTIQHFGSDVYSYQLEDPLEDGQHTISVMVQGIYGYWSQPTTITVDISNTPGSTVTLTGDFRTQDAILSWTGTSGKTYVYRDGKKIAATTLKTFTDRYVLGEHTWYVIEPLVDGNYNVSATISGRVIACENMIALLSGGEWMTLKLSEKSASDQVFNFSKQYSVMHISGAVYPMLELGEHEDLVGSYDCAFNDIEQAKAFESFRGKPIIMKSRGGNVLFGAITQMKSHFGDFLIGYTFSVQRIDVEDFINDSNS